MKSLLTSVTVLLMAGGGLYAHPHAESCRTTVYFDTNVAQVNGAGQTKLKTLAKALTSPTYEVVGYADAVGATGDNLALSKRRVMSVVSMLNDLGIKSSRLKTGTAVGESGAEHQGPDAKYRRVDVVEAQCGGHGSHHINWLTQNGTRFGAAPDADFSDLPAEHSH